MTRVGVSQGEKTDQNVCPPTTLSSGNKSFQTAIRVLENKGKPDWQGRGQEEGFTRKSVRRGTNITRGPQSPTSKKGRGKPGLRSS